MKVLACLLVTLVVIVVVWLVGLSITSRKQPELEMVNGQLQPCPATPNCVCSEFPSKNFHVGPLGYSGTSDEAWSRLKRVISDTGGKVIAEKSDYLRAVYQTPLLRFVDDVEFRLNTDQAVIHVRSASRVGHSDLGANRQRVEKIRARFGELTD